MINAFYFCAFGYFANNSKYFGYGRSGGSGSVAFSLEISIDDVAHSSQVI